MKNRKLWIHALILSASLLLGSHPASVYGAQQQNPASPAAEQTPETQPSSGDPAAAPADSAAAEVKDPNAPPDSYNWEVQSDSIKGWPVGPQVAAETAILMDVDSGEILYAKGIDERRYPASTTKIMTALLAIENCPLSDSITFTAEAVNNIEPGSTHIGIKPGEILTMEQSLYAILLASANEVSSGVAEYVGGTIPAFIDMMNAKAQELGCENTHFVNANGLHDDNHYTTARDLAVISREAFKNETFRKIIGTEYFVEPVTNITNEERWLNNHHKMLLSGAQHYEGCLGGKTGYTTAAGNTLVTFAQRDDMCLVAVILADNAVYQYTDTAALLDYGFSCFHKENLPSASQASILRALPFEQNLFHIGWEEHLTRKTGSSCVCLPENISAKDLTSAVTVDGNLVKTDYYLEDQLITSTEITVLKSPSLSSVFSETRFSKTNSDKEDNRLLTKVLSSEKTKSSGNPDSGSGILKNSFLADFAGRFRSLPKWEYPALIFLVCAVIFYIILLNLKLRRKRKRRKRKKKKKRK